MYYLMVFVGQDSGHGLDGRLQGCNQNAVKAEFSSELNWEKLCSQAHMVVNSIQFLVGCQTEGLSFLLAVGWRVPLVPCHVVLSTRKLIAWQLALHSQQGQVSPCKLITKITCRVITYTSCTPCHLCHVLLVGSKSQVLPTLKGREGFMQGREYQEVEIIEGCLRVCPLQGLTPQPRIPSWGCKAPNSALISDSSSTSLVSFWLVESWVGELACFSSVMSS